MIWLSLLFGAGVVFYSLWYYLDLKAKMEGGVEANGVVVGYLSHKATGRRWDRYPPVGLKFFYYLTIVVLPSGEEVIVYPTRYFPPALGVSRKFILSEHKAKGTEFRSGYSQWRINSALAFLIVLAFSFALYSAYVLAFMP